MALVTLSELGLRAGQTLREASPNGAEALARAAGVTADAPLTAHEVGRRFVADDTFLRTHGAGTAAQAAAVAGRGDRDRSIGATAQTAGGGWLRFKLASWVGRRGPATTAEATGQANRAAAAEPAPGVPQAGVTRTATSAPVEPQAVGSETGAAAVTSPSAPAPTRPAREQLATEAEFRAAYLVYQDARMAELRARYPHAVVSGRLNYGTSELTPEQVMKDGIPPKRGDNFDLLAHQTEGIVSGDGRAVLDTSDPRNASALRGGSENARTPGHCAGTGGWVFVVEPQGMAISLADALGEQEHVSTRGEVECSFGSCQPPERIVGWRRVGRYSDMHDAFALGELVPNPRYRPRGG